MATTQAPKENGTVNRVEGLIQVKPAETVKVLSFKEVYGVLQPRVSKQARPGYITTDEGKIKVTLKKWPAVLTEDGFRAAGCTAGASITLPKGVELTVDGITYDGKGNGTILPEDFMGICNALKSLLS